ncbi:putative monooxygenase [Mycena maculata]|uniref:Monooxygenase n=1 Tax=Mycena maculata TaxID=230809 RepID=A0AAD7HY01_9AGAR|nr:putative monooxygenase [Mycena maculata]
MELTTKDIIFLSAVCIGYIVFVGHRSRAHSPPPGPRRLPVLGSLLDVPQTYPWLTFSKWARKYGEIVYFEVLGRPFVVLNSAKAAKALLDERSFIYSERPRFEMANLSGYDRTFVLQPYNNTWRQQRKMVAQELAPRILARYHAFQEAEARALVRSVVEDPDNLQRLVKLRIGAIIIRIAYGHYISSDEDSFLKLGIATMQNFDRAVAPGAWLVDIIPSLKYLPKWLPGTGFFTLAEQWRNQAQTAAWEPYRWAKEHSESGTALLPNLCANALAGMGEDPSHAHQEQLVWSASTMMAGGMDSSVISSLNFILEMMLHPKIQAKAQEEIDTVVGRSRLPAIPDKASLPYVRSVITEVLRLNPAIPLGIPHSLRRDDIYEGMYLPKGSVVTPNIWNMLHDPDVFPNPMEFNPDRYQNLDSEMEKVTEVIFGFGRRLCPGKLFAEGTIFALVATTLATCDVLPAVDAEGNESPTNVTFSSGVFSSPSEFKCIFKYRSEHSREMLYNVLPGNAIDIGPPEGI